MKFKSKLSTKQINSIFYFLLGIAFLFINPVKFPLILKFAGIFLILFSIENFISESIRRYKIIRPFQKNNYDSKAEEKIAAYFKRKNIIFYHNYIIKVPRPFWIFEIPFIKIKFKPDFYLPEFNVFVEYWGMLDNPEYKERYRKKIKHYKRNGIEYISLYPKNLKNLDFVFTSKLLDILKEREGNKRV